MLELMRWKWRRTCQSMRRDDRVLLAVICLSTWGVGLAALVITLVAVLR